MNKAVDKFLETSELVWFRPLPYFFSFFQRSEWKWRRYHDCGAGTGLLTQAMLKNKLECVAYDRHPRKKSLAKVEPFDTANIADRMDFSEVALIARPCHHPEFIDVTLRSALEMGEAFYIGLARNFERDLEHFEYDVVAMDVGEEGEDLVRIRCARDKFFIRCQIENPSSKRLEWWWHKHGRYTSEPGGLAGFTDSSLKPLKEEHWASDLQLTSSKEVECLDDSPHGWIAPDGEWFGCGYALHDYIARTVLGCSVKRLEQLGFCRCHEENGKLYWRQGDSFRHTFSHIKKYPRVTPKQKATLKARGFDPKYYD